MKQLLVPFLSGLMAIAVATPEVRCQKKPIPKPGKKATQPVKGDSLSNYRKDRGEKHLFEDPGELYAPGTNVPLEKRVGIKGLGNFVQAFVGTVPGRLAPGQAGELRVVLALKGKYVLQQGMFIDLRYRRQQGRISLGKWDVNPAGIGKLDTVYRGRPVYDNTATITIPISIGSQAVYGEKHLGLEVEVDVSNGETGGFHGRYMMDVRAKIEVGKPLPVIQQSAVDEEIAAPIEAASATASNQSGAGTSRARDAGISTDTVGPSELVGTRSGSIDRAQGGAADEPGAVEFDAGGSEGGINWLLYSVPTGLLLLILFMAMRKGKA